VSNTGKEQQGFLRKLESFDRRWIFLIMAMAVVLPLYFPIGLPIKAGPMTKAAFASVEDLKDGDTVLVSMDLDPASTPELEPYYRARTSRWCLSPCGTQHHR
jgi:hypothetical protein